MTSPTMGDPARSVAGDRRSLASALSFRLIAGSGPYRERGGSPASRSWGTVRPAGLRAVSRRVRQRQLEGPEIKEIPRRTTGNRKTPPRPSQARRGPPWRFEEGPERQPNLNYP